MSELDGVKTMHTAKTQPRAAVSWSGGKDSALALHRASERFDIAGLITVMIEDGSRSRSHGLRRSVLEAQAKALDLPLLTVNADWQNYEAQFDKLLRRARRWDISHAIFGDVFPDAHKAWAENVSRRAGLEAVEPLWGEPTQALAEAFLASGGRARITTVREDRLDGKVWLGRELDRDALRELRDRGVDPGGENGEFHTVVTRFPNGEAISLNRLDTLSHAGCGLCDFTVAT